MMNYEILRIKECSQLTLQASQWFHEKWGVPKEAYHESMEESLKDNQTVPQWYVAMKDDKIIGGLGVIENDFHDRTDLAPNVCAVYVEEEYRNQGIAGTLLGYVCDDFKKMGVDTLYLLTDHIGLYERYGWEFFCMAQGDGEPEMSRIYIHRS